MTVRPVAWPVAAAFFLAGLAGCGGTDAGGDPASPRGNGPSTPQQVAVPPLSVPDSRPEVDLYEPASAESHPNGKRLAGRVAQRAVTYRRGADAAEVAESLGPSAVGRGALAEAIEPLVEPSARSRGAVVYPQLSGLTPTTMGAMVVVRQVRQEEGEPEETVTRVLDVRLRRPSGGSWELDRVASVGGSPAERPDDLSEAARRVVDHPDITLPDSARWDIFRGEVDDRLLTALAGAADRYPLSIAVLSSGHPPNVWASSRPSAHASGLAADIYAVDGRLVARQREAGSAAHALTRSLVAGGAFQVGSPWALPGVGTRSFTDEVHLDHVHLHQAAG